MTQPGMSLVTAACISIVVLTAARATAADLGIAAPEDAVDVRVLADRADQIVVRCEIRDFSNGRVLVDGREYTRVSAGEESLMKVVGAPAVPNICRSLVIPDDARMSVRVLDSKHYDVEDIDVPPSKGFILRTVDPEDVPYTFGDAYNTDAFYPGALATLRDPYILRDHRGVVIEFNPFQYNPIQRVLRVYTTITVELIPTGPGEVNVLKRRPQPRDLSAAFHRIYANQFLNYDLDRAYVSPDETGEMLIISHDAWLSNLGVFIDHKSARGLSTTAVGVSSIGNDAVAIKDYIQAVYDSSDLAFVLLVGDAAEVASPFVTVGGATEPGDPTYALLAGGDSYPDILVGRFSAQTAAQIDTQVQRVVEYEQMPAALQDWFWRGTGIASHEGPGDDGEYDFEHIDNIRTNLMAHGYPYVDRIYDPGAKRAQVTAALNAGRGIVNYTGHGSTVSWGTTGFSITDINNLANHNRLPFVFSVACVNGTFDNYTCFAEAWMRATSGTEPTGAIGMYASSVNQYWSPPMCAQDEFVDLLVAEAYGSLGALCYAGSCKMIDEYGSGGVDMFETWHLFGDPSLQVVVSYGPHPPLAHDSEAMASVDTPTLIPLFASDDGEPDPPGRLAYSVLTLPEHGMLVDPGAGPIVAAPHTLIDYGRQVQYAPEALYTGWDSIEFQADDGGQAPDGGLSGSAYVSIGVSVEPPIVEAAGCRYIAVTPQPPDGSVPVALLVTSPNYPCIEKYADASGLLIDTPIFRPIAEWGTAYLHGQDVIPNTTYIVETTLTGNPSGGGASAMTVRWGDVVGLFVEGAWTPADGNVAIIDAVAALDRFRGLPTAPPLPWCDIEPASPDGVVNITDVGYIIDAFKALPYPFEIPCE